MELCFDTNDTTELWKDISGSKYQISIVGKIRRKLKNGKYRYIKSYKKKKWLAVKVRINGEYKEIYVHKLMAKVFNIQGNKGEVLHFINGDINDPSLHNLEYIDRKKLGKKTGAKSWRKPVAKLNENGELIEVYPSARECGRQNYMSYQTIIDRCNGKVKSKFAQDGYQYIWESKIKY